jgi:hypothetical protein
MRCRLTAQVGRLRGPTGAGKVHGLTVVEQTARPAWTGGGGEQEISRRGGGQEERAPSRSL